MMFLLLLISPHHLVKLDLQDLVTVLFVVLALEIFKGRDCKHFLVFRTSSSSLYYILQKSNLLLACSVLMAVYRFISEEILKY
jgi:hypothetical protein